MSAKKQYWKIRDKILITVIVSFFSLLLILVSLNAYNMYQQGQQEINSYKDDMIDEVREKLQNIVEIARDVANYYFQQAGPNSRSQSAAQEEAKAIISTLRYQNDEGYIWINDTSNPYPRMVMHPINPELNGKELNNPEYNTAGTEKKNLFVAMKELALNQGFGYVPYMWPKPNVQGLQPKESYVAYFEPWDWVIGHGVYTDDIMIRLAEKNRETTANAFSMSMSFIVITLILSVIIFTAIFIILNQLTKAVNALVDLSQKASQGNLCTNTEFDLLLKTRKNDEIGLLLSHFDMMIQNMRQSMGKTRETSEINLSEKDRLISSAEESAAASEEIQRNVKQISERSENLHNQASETAKSIIAISDNINTLKEQIHEQLSMVEESSASIIEMSSNIKNVADITKAKQISSENLIATVENGGRFIHSMADITGDLLSKMESINDMTHLINKISSQTNLLAMNAAIEASHAGESGKGFAVVADEIRKLAENSNISSKQIQNLIKEMVSIAKRAEVSGQDSRAAFSQIKNDVEEVANAFSEITYSTTELTTGAMQIREAVTQLSVISNEVSTQYDEIDTTTNNVKTGCKEVMSITEYMKNALLEISTAVDLITESIAGVREISLKLDDISVQLNSEISKYVLN